MERLSCLVLGFGGVGMVRGVCRGLPRKLRSRACSRFLGGKSDGSVDDKGL